MAFTTALTALASGVRTTTGTGAAVDTGAAPHTTVELLLNVTAASGSDPSLSVEIETSRDGVIGWRSIPLSDNTAPRPSFTVATEVTSEWVTLTGCDRYIRVVWTIAGIGPSFTFSVTGISVMVYATPSQLFQLGVKEESFEGLTYVELDTALRAATGRINDTYGTITELPLTAWGDSTTRACSIIGAVNALTMRGAEPTAPADDWLMTLYREIMGPEGHPEDGWLGLVAAGKLVPEGLVDSTTDEEEGGWYAVSDVRRGW